MFDPSKLDLDLDDSKKEHIPVPKEQIKDALKKIEKVPEKKDEISILDTKSSLTQEEVGNDTNEIHQAFMESETKNDEKKAEEKKEEQAEIKQKEENIIGDISDVINNNQKLKNVESKISKVIQDSDLIDININSLQDILNILIQQDYDLFILEPRDNDVKISFRKEKVEKDVKYIKFPIYNKILLKSKAITKMKIEETQIGQEGKGEIHVKDKKYKIISKTVPSSFGEKILVKIQELQKKITKKGEQKTSLGKLFGFLGVIAIIALIIGGAFIGFIVMNAKTLEDVKFFSSLGINLNDINVFISKAVNTIFSILIFIETIFLAIYLFKFILTKKIYKKKKIASAIFSLIILIITFSTGSAWMVINKKIASLPNWQEMAYGDVQIYDNSKLISEKFSKKLALVQDTSHLIGPMVLKYDLSNWARKQEQTGFKIKRYIWSFGKDKKEELTPVIIYNFNKKGTSNISLEVIGVNPKGEEITKTVENIQPVSITSLVTVTEEVLESGGKTVRFNAQDLKDLGKIEWYYGLEDSENTKPFVGYEYDPGKIIFEDTLIGMYIKRNGKDSEQLDKIFIINKNEENSIVGEIKFKQDIVNDLKYTFSVKNPDTGFGNGFIESFDWELEDEIVRRESDKENIEESSTIEHIFQKYGEQKIVVKLRDSSGKTKTLRTTINVPKRLKLKTNMRIYNNGDILKTVRHEASNHEYYLDELAAPTQLKFDTRLIRANNILYTLKSVSWDTNGDGKTDRVGKTFEYPVNVEGNHTIEATYHFAHRKIEGDNINIVERVYIEAIKKEAILSLHIEPETNYVPTYVRFDASKSEVKGKNIEKFIYDYGDGIIDERDAINPAHKYTQPGEYNIYLTVITTDGSEYSIAKKLVLKPKPQKVQIVTSMKKAPINQGIDFSSDESEGQIIGYFWDFGDGEVSTEANPTHAYEVAGDYTVTLKINFQNNNTLKDEIDIEVIEE